MKTHSHLFGVLIGLLIGIWMLPAATMAQNTSDNMQIVRGKLLADRKLFVADNMELTKDALAYLCTSEGFEIRVGPSFVVVDEGMAKSLTTTTAKEDVYAFIFNQESLLAALNLQGSKLTRLEKYR